MRKLLSVLVLSLICISLVACSGEKASTNGNSTKELKTVKVGYMPNYSSLNTVVAGIETGSFEEEGLNVELVEFADGPTIISAMESGSIDVGFIGPGAHVLPIQGKAEIIAFSHLGNADEVIGNKEKGVTSIDDLKGKTIAIASGTSSETILKLALEEAGLTKDDVTLMDMDASAIVTAMISGSVDAAATWSPNTNSIKGELGGNAVSIANNVRYADQFPSICSWVVAPGYSEKNPDVVLSFTKGLYKAMDYRIDHLDEVAEWVAKQSALNVDSVLKETETGDWTTSEELITMIEDGTLEALYKKQQENFFAGGSLKDLQPVSVDKYVLFDNMIEAGK